MKELKVETDANGTITCETGISSNQWLEILSSPKLNKSQLNVLLMFYREPGHKACCSAIAKKYAMSSTGVSNYIWHLAKFAANYVGGLSLMQGDNSKLWPVLMNGKDLKNNFEWTVKDEVAQAIRQYLIQKLLSAYRSPILEEGLDNKVSNELYKWKFLKECEGKSREDVLSNMVSQSLNPNLMAWRSRDNLKKAMASNCGAVVDCFRLLEDDSVSFPVKFEGFRKRTDSVVQDGQNNHMHNERTATLYLTCMNPQKDTFFMPSFYELYCSYIGEEEMQNAERYPHFLRLLDEITIEEKKDTELQNRLRVLTSDYIWSDLLNAQDVLWQTQYLMKESQKNWLQKIYDDYLATSPNAFSDGGWFSSYKKNVSLFRKTILDADDAGDCSEEFLYEFMVHRNNGIADVGWGGQYRTAEFEVAYGCWPEIFPYLKHSLEAGEIIEEDYNSVWGIMYEAEGFTRKHPNAIRRLWSGLFPNHVTTTVDTNPFYSVYAQVREIGGDLVKPSGSWQKDNVELVKYLNQHVSFEDPWHSSLFAWILTYSMDIKEENDMDEFTSQLKESYNLILTGAPGTGKTWLANAIAESMGADRDAVEMVQFHPSYDYTDFVEGIRPTEDGGFRREDGVFKAFCKKALKAGMQNCIDNFEETWAKLVDLLDENDFLDIPYLSKQGCFRVELNEYGTGLANRTYENGEFDKGNWVSGQSKFFSKEQLYNIYRGLPGTQRRGHDNYRRAIVNYMKKNLGLLEYKEGVENTSLRPFVFIIDEINRGEVSKIFGELFFSIDPGYRKKEHRKPIKTQYQNLVGKEDEFAEGFFVPENVYIIGTMNDIDRSVESMDFAIRRRFAWMEITPEKRISMWDDRIEEWKEEAEKRMCSLNKAICDPSNGLGPEYCIGPAYFLKLEDYTDDDRFEKLWNLNLKGVLGEYLRGNRRKEEIMINFKKEYDLKGKNNEQ